MNLSALIIAFGYIGVFSAIFLESGFFLGFFLPGDSLLFTVGLLSVQGIFNIGILFVIALTAAVLGSCLGYWTGSFFGETVFSWHRVRRFINPRSLEKTREFFKKYGPKTVIMCRFVPVVRTFAPIFAGIGDMKFSLFFIYNTIGAILWAGGLMGIAYFLGSRFPVLHQYLSLIIVLIIVISVIPLFVSFFHKKTY